MKSKKKSYFINVLIILMLTLGSLWLALKDNYQLIIEQFSKMNFLYLILILFWGALFTAVWGLVYYVYGKKYKQGYSIRNGMAVSFVGAFFAGITPSSTGGQFFQVYIMDKQGIKYSDSASILWADFIIYQTTMMIYVTILFALKFNYYLTQSKWLYILLVGYLINLIVVIALYTIAIFPNFYIKLSQKLVVFLGKIHILKDPEHQLIAWNEQIHNFTVQIKILSKDKASIFKCVIINFVRLTLLFSLPFVIAKGLAIPIDYSQLLDVIALSSFVTTANSFIPIPGASGGTELVFSLLFNYLFADLTGAVLVLWRFSSYHLVLFFGGILFLYAKRKYESKK